MDTFAIFSVVLPLALSAGVNLYATVLVAGLALRLGLITSPPAGVEILAAWPVLIVAGILYAFEFFASKIQFVDNIWDFFHTLIRPTGAALMGFGIVEIADPEFATAAGLAAGTVALVSHSGKAGSRISLNVTSPAENLSNIGLSLAEDLGVAVLTYLALQYPVIAASIALLVLAALLLIGPRLARWTWFMLRALGARLRSLAGGARQAETLPAQYAALTQQRPEITASSTAHHVRGATGKTGFLSLAGPYLLFNYRTWFRPRLWHLDLRQITGANLRRRMLMDVLEVHYLDERQRTQTSRFVFLKDRFPLTQEVARRLGAALPGR